MKQSKIIRKPPNPDKLFHLRILGRLSGQLFFGDPEDENSWYETEEGAVMAAKERADRQQEDLGNIWIHIKKHNQDGTVEHEVRNNSADKL